MSGLSLRQTWKVYSGDAHATEVPRECERGIYSVHFLDPDGYLWEIIYNKRYYSFEATA